MTTLALYSNKGGVGKTAAAVNLAYLAAQAGLSTLICDLDPQSSATFYFRVKPRLKRKARSQAEKG
jgi:chromosome partitioning protein